MEFKGIHVLSADKFKDPTIGIYYDDGVYFTVVDNAAIGDKVEICGSKIISLNKKDKKGQPMYKAILTVNRIYEYKNIRFVDNCYIAEKYCGNNHYGTEKLPTVSEISYTLDIKNDKSTKRIIYRVDDSFRSNTRIVSWYDPHCIELGKVEWEKTPFYELRLAYLKAKQERYNGVGGTPHQTISQLSKDIITGNFEVLNIPSEKDPTMPLWGCESCIYKIGEFKYRLNITALDEDYIELNIPKIVPNEFPFDIDYEYLCAYIIGHANIPDYIIEELGIKNVYQLRSKFFGIQDLRVLLESYSPLLGYSDELKINVLNSEYVKKKADEIISTLNLSENEVNNDYIDLRVIPIVNIAIGERIDASEEGLGLENLYVSTKETVGVLLTYKVEINIKNVGELVKKDLSDIMAAISSQSPEYDTYTML